MSLFVDTWGWVALQNKGEARHATVKAYYRDFRKRGLPAYTTDYVLTKRSRCSSSDFLWPRRRSRFSVLTMRQAGYLHVAWIWNPVLRR